MDLTNATATQARTRMGQEVNQLKRQVNQLTSSKSFKGKDAKGELMKASKGFEEIFVHKMLTTMRDSGVKSDLMDGGPGEKVFRGMLDQEYAKIITESGDLGLSKMIYEQTKDNL